MKRLRYGVYSLFFVLSLVTSLLIPSGVASATSDYDEVFNAAVSARVSDTYGTHTCTTQDIASSWRGYLMDDSKWGQAVYSGTDRETVQAALSTALSNGDGWAVVEREFLAAGTSIGNFVWGSGDHGVQVVFTPDASNETTFFTYNGSHYATLKGTDSAPVYVVIIGQYWDGSTNSCNVGVAVSRVLASNDSSANFVSGEAYVGYGNLDPNVNRIYRQLFIDSYIAYPAGYEGGLIPTEPPVATYVSMGDSYSSGEGNPQFEYGTDVSNQNGCHRSPRAYPRLLQAQLDLGPTAFVACSGATTANITGGQWNEPPQTDALTDETELVTLGVGGNNVDFVGYAMSCAVACGPGSGPYNTIMGKINDPDFKRDLVNTYEEVLDAAPNADLYVADYPYLAEEDATTCWGLDFSGAYEVQEALNEAIFDAVIEVGLDSSRIFMVQTNYPGSPFEGGELCGDGDPLFNGLVAPPNVEYSLHPNEGGHQAYADVFEEAIA